MSTIYPDVNKNWINDIKLCWAAASSNVLVYAGWNRLFNNRTEYEIYDLFRNKYDPGQEDVGNSPICAIDWLLNHYFLLNIPIESVIQSRSPHDLFLAKQTPPLATGGCGIIQINWDSTPLESHVVTMYGLTVRNTLDPRAVRQIVIVDSDDHYSGLKYIDVNYDAAKRTYPIQLYGNDGQITCWSSISVCPF